MDRYINSLDEESVFWDPDDRNSAFFCIAKGMFPSLVDEPECWSDSLLLCLQDEAYRLMYANWVDDIFNLIYLQNDSAFRQTVDNVVRLYGKRVVSEEIVRLLVEYPNRLYSPFNDVVLNRVRSIKDLSWKLSAVGLEIDYSWRDWINPNVRYYPAGTSRGTVIAMREFYMKNKSPNHYLKAFGIESFGLVNLHSFALHLVNGHYELHDCFGTNAQRSATAGDSPGSDDAERKLRFNYNQEQAAGFISAMLSAAVLEHYPVAVIHIKLSMFNELFNKSRCGAIDDNTLLQALLTLMESQGVRIKSIEFDSECVNTKNCFSPPEHQRNLRGSRSELPFDKTIIIHLRKSYDVAEIVSEIESRLDSCHQALLERGEVMFPDDMLSVVDQALDARFDGFKTDMGSYAHDMLRLLVSQEHTIHRIQTNADGDSANELLATNCDVIMTLLCYLPLDQYVEMLGDATQMFRAGEMPFDVFFHLLFPDENYTVVLAKNYDSPIVQKLLSQILSDQKLLSLIPIVADTSARNLLYRRMTRVAFVNMVEDLKNGNRWNAVPSSASISLRERCEQDPPLIDAVLGR